MAKTVECRIEELEQAAPPAETDEEPPVIVIAWEESELTEEQRAAKAKAREWYAKHPGYKPDRVIVRWGEVAEG